MTETGKQDQEVSQPRAERRDQRLREELKAIQRQVNEQEGQLKVLLIFVQTDLHEQVDSPPNMRQFALRRE
jgi:hypothetical protein